jgi:glycine cleavage system H lipoate-binding protein
MVTITGQTDLGTTDLNISTGKEGTKETTLLENITNGPAMRMGTAMNISLMETSTGRKNGKTLMALEAVKMLTASIYPGG